MAMQWLLAAWLQRGSHRWLPLLICLSLLGACQSQSDPVLEDLLKREIVVLYTTEEPIIPDLPDDCCLYLPLEGFKNTKGKQADTVIVAGHGLPPYFASHDIEYVADAVASFQPELVVMNSCYGASTDILGAFSQRGLESYVVAAPFPIYQPGFIFEPAFFTGSLTEKIQAVRTEPEYPVLRWKINAEELQAVEKQVNALSPAELKQRLRRVLPALVRMEMPTAFGKDTEILVPLPPERFETHAGS